MSNKKKYHLRNKDKRKSQRMKGNRQAMPPPNWPAKSAVPDRPKSPDLEPPQRKEDHQENGRDIGRLENDALRPGGGQDLVDSGGRKDDLLPFSQDEGGRIHTPYGTFTKNSEGILQLDGSQEEDKKRVSVERPAVKPPVNPAQHATTAEVPPLPSSSGPAVDAQIHPSRACLHQQSLINRIVERLRDEEGLSPKAIADLLKKGAHLLPPETQTDLGPTGRVQLPAHPEYVAPPQSSIIGVNFEPVTIDRNLKDPLLIAESLNTTTLDDKTNTTEMSQTKILIPRSAGIKIRGVLPEPPLIDAPAPDKSKIVVSSQYLFQHSLEAAGLMDERDVQGRLQGIAIIEATRRNLRMPMKTYGTACVFFMRYRYHVATKGAEDEEVRKYDFRDAALASLWLASKAEETPKKSKEILCAFRNTTLPPEEHLTPDDEIFENQAKLMINLERYLLEIVAFDFRARNCAELLAGLMVELESEEKVVRTAMAVALDLYRTLAVLKQTRQTLALACVEMASRFVQADDAGKVTSEELYKRVGTSRQEVLGKCDRPNDGGEYADLRRNNVRSY
jgi:CTD kinase subunit beta